MKANPLNQLCLFSDEQMTEMVELPPEKPVTVPTGDNSTWLQWQLQVGQQLTGKAGRQHRKMFSKQKVKKVKEKKVKEPPVQLTDAQISEMAMIDCLRDDGYTGPDPIYDFLSGNHPTRRRRKQK
jgi:hypothetical protein